MNPVFQWDKMAIPYFWIITSMLCGLLAYEIFDLVHFHAHVINESDLSKTDFGIYYNAAIRFLNDPSQIYDVARSGSLRGYLYPPISILLFVPFTLVEIEVAHAAFLLLNGILIFVSAWLVALTVAATKPSCTVYNRRSALFLLLIATSGPVFTNSVSNQANVVVLTFTLAAIYLGFHGRHAWASAFLATACWIKIYPALLLLTMFALPRLRKTALHGIVIGIVAPILLLSIVPLSSYYTYFLELLPVMSEKITANTYNQSLTAAIVRLQTPPSEWFAYIHDLKVAPWIRWLNIGVLLAFLAAIFVGWRQRTATGQFIVALASLAMIPIISPLGWGHAYVFSIVLVCYLTVFSNSQVLTWIGVVAWAGLLLPAYSHLGGARLILGPALSLMYFRYPLLVAICVVVALLFASASSPLKAQ